MLPKEIELEVTGAKGGEKKQMSSTAPLMTFDK